MGYSWSTADEESTLPRILLTARSRVPYGCHCCRCLAWRCDLAQKMSKLGFRSAETGNVGNSYLAFWLSCWPRRFCLQPRPMWTCCPALWRGWCRSCRSWPGGDLSFYSVDAVDGLYYYNICIYIFKIYTYTYIYIFQKNVLSFNREERRRTTGFGSSLLRNKTTYEIQL